jgi:hypothetical protein
VSTAATPVADALRAALVGPAPYTERLAAVQRLRNSLRPEEKQALYDFLARRSPEDEQQSGHVLKNAVLNVLVTQPAPLPDLAEHLARWVQDAHLHVVIRDYALQHVAAFYGELDRAPAEVAAASRRVLREALFDALSEHGTSLPGTALLGLARLAEKDEAFDRGRIREAGLALAHDQDAGELARVSALQVCARLGLGEIVPLCAELAAGASSIPLRLSAIAALGQLGGAAELPRLNQLISEKDHRLRPALTLALERIQARLAQAATVASPPQ